MPGGLRGSPAGCAMSAAEYSVIVPASAAWLGLVPGHRAWFDPDGAPALPGDIAMVTLRGFPPTSSVGQPFLTRLSAKPPKWAVRGKREVLMLDQPDGRMIGWRPRYVEAVDRLTRVEA